MLVPRKNLLGSTQRAPGSSTCNPHLLYFARIDTILDTNNILLMFTIYSTTQ